MPLVAASGLVVQASVPPGLVPMARVIEVVGGDHVAAGSSTLTAGWVVQVGAVGPAPGWVVKTSWVAAPMVMVKAELGGPGEPPEAAVSV